MLTEPLLPFSAAKDFLTPSVVLVNGSMGLVLLVVLAFDLGSISQDNRTESTERNTPSIFPFLCSKKELGILTTMIEKCIPSSHAMARFVSY
jgi:hypothetical protein